MKWIDYRDKLGIGLSDEEKATMFKNKMLVLLGHLKHNNVNQHIVDSICRQYFITVGESSIYYHYGSVMDSITESNTLKEALSKAVAFSNAYDKHLKNEPIQMINVIKACLDQLNIPNESTEDEDGVFIFPQGAKELDDALVSETYQWLSCYPLSQKAMRKAVMSYSDKEDPTEVADNFRKCLETFFKEFLNTEKSLEKINNEYGAFMKNKGVPKELSNHLEKLVSLYRCFMNEYAKHNDKTSEKWLEFIMYLTGNLIRFMINLKENEKN